jgi:hypothetical protein
MDPAYAYTTRNPNGVESSTLAPTVAFVRTPGVSGVKPFLSTNRSQKIADIVKNDQIQDDVMRALEGTPRTMRGSRNLPSVMRYPEEIGTGEVPHVMQFKVFWRWENKDIAQKVKEETEKTIEGLNTLSSLISQDILTKEMVEQSGLEGEEISALKELANNTQLLKVVDPSINDTLANLLTNNPKQAKLVLEETIKSYQNRLGNIEQEISDGLGKIGPDEMERLMITNRLSENYSRSTFLGVDIGTLGAGLAGAGAAGVLSYVFGGGAATTIGAAALGGVGAGVIAKNFKTQAVYDQMVSIYLPFCTKINNEDSFQYEDTSQAIAGGAGDLLGVAGSLGTNIVTTASQLTTLGMENLAGRAGAGGAGSLLTGAVLNPRLEKLFKQKDFRNFNFSWEFYPRNKKEVDQIRDIIETFRYHSHPAMFDASSGGEQTVQIQLRVPAEFEIRFLSTNPSPNASGFVENEYIPRIGRCALNSISVDYTPNSIFSSFTDNSPTAVVVTMQFSEMGILTREVVEKGY